ncbi:MAG: ATP-binding cassette domain-containing protein, partial [Desulfobacteraceae bacterium]
MLDPHPQATPLLEARDIVKHYPILGGVWMKPVGSVQAVDGVSLTIGEGETVGLVGESGCGKTTFGRAILRLEEPTSGEIFFRGRDILACSRNEMQALRREMQIIFQDPFSSLNPRKTVGQIIGEPLLVHGVGSRQERDRRVL